MSDSVKGALQRFIRGTVRGEVDYFACYGGKVVQQQTDGTVDVQCDDTRLPGFQRIRVRWGAPGVLVTFAPNAIVLVGFENGDPGRPYVAGMAFDGATVVRLGAQAGDGSDATEAAWKGTTGRQYQKQMHNDLAGKLSALSTDLAAAATVFAAIAATASAPVLGGAMSGLATPLGAAVADAAAAAAVLTAYETAAAARGDDLSTRVKLK